jgi:hypothetical protein
VQHQQHTACLAGVRVSLHLINKTPTFCWCFVAVAVIIINLSPADASVYPPLSSTAVFSK